MGEPAPSCIRSAGDFDLDGVPDLLVSASGTDYAGYQSGSFYAISGAGLLAEMVP